MYICNSEKLPDGFCNARFMKPSAKKNNPTQNTDKALPGTGGLIKTTAIFLYLSQLLLLLTVVIKYLPRLKGESQE